MNRLFLALPLVWVAGGCILVDVDLNDAACDADHACEQTFHSRLLKILDRLGCSDPQWMGLRCVSSLAPNFGRSA